MFPVFLNVEFGEFLTEVIFREGSQSVENNLLHVACVVKV
jgi:hypothetical protein